MIQPKKDALDDTLNGIINTLTQNFNPKTQAEILKEVIKQLKGQYEGQVLSASAELTKAQEDYDIFLTTLESKDE